MKKLLLVLVSVPLFANAQNALSLIVDNDIVVEKYYGEALTVPIVIENEFYGFHDKHVTFELVLNEDSTRNYSLDPFPEKYMESFKVRNRHLLIDEILGKSKGTFYIDIPANVSIDKRVRVFFDLMVKDKVVETINVVVIPRINEPISYDDFSDNRKYIMDEIWHAEPSDGLFIVYGEKNNQRVKKKVYPNKSGTFLITDDYYLFSRYYFDSKPVSIITLPIKIRPGFRVDEVSYDAKNTFGFRNIGINFDLVGGRNRRFDLSGNIKTNGLSLGIMFLASVDEVELGTIENHFFFSSGITISYKLNRLSLIIVPLSFDISNSIPNQRDWVYSGRAWWGAGVGVNL